MSIGAGQGADTHVLHHTPSGMLSGNRLVGDRGLEWIGRLDSLQGLRSRLLLLASNRTGDSGRAGGSRDAAATGLQHDCVADSVAERGVGVSRDLSSGSWSGSRPLL